MNKKETLKRLSFLTIAVFFAFAINGTIFGQTTVFSDDFSTNTSTTYTTTGTIGASTWSVNRSGDDWGARRNTSPQQLELTNDASASTNANGWVFANTTTSSFASPYNSVLNSNPGKVTWTFNMRQIRSDPAGFGVGLYGVAFILGSTSSTVATAGDGYAVVLGNSGTTDPIRLAKFTNGLQGTITDIITSNTPGLTDFGNEYLSINVTYMPSTNQWELFVRNDGSSAFADPAMGTLTSQGTAVDNTYTGVSLNFMGAYWQGATAASQTAFFDNVKVTVINTSAADATISGRITTTSGRGIRNVRVMLSGGNLTQPIYAQTSPFGFYRFDGLSAGETYVVTVYSKSYYFGQASRVITLQDNVTNADFVAEERLWFGK